MEGGRLRLILAELCAVTLVAAISFALVVGGYRESVGHAQAAHVYHPSGGTIAAVWSILFAALAWCRWRALREGHSDCRSAALVVMNLRLDAQRSQQERDQVGRVLLHCGICRQRA